MRLKDATLRRRMIECEEDRLIVHILFWHPRKAPRIARAAHRTDEAPQAPGTICSACCDVVESRPSRATIWAPPDAQLSRLRYTHIKAEEIEPLRPSNETSGEDVQDGRRGVC